MLEEPRSEHFGGFNSCSLQRSRSDLDLVELLREKALKEILPLMEKDERNLKDRRPKSDKPLYEDRHLLRRFTLSRRSALSKQILLLCFRSFTLLSLCFVHLCSLFWKALDCESQRRIVSACWRARPPMRKSCRPYLNTRSDNWRQLRNHRKSSESYMLRGCRGLYTPHANLSDRFTMVYLYGWVPYSFEAWLGCMMSRVSPELCCLMGTLGRVLIVLRLANAMGDPGDTNCFRDPPWSSIVLRFMAAMGFGWLRHAMAAWIFPGTLCLPLLSVGICVASFSPCLQLASLLVSHSVSAVGTLQLTGAWNFLCHHHNGLDSGPPRLDYFLIDIIVGYRRHANTDTPPQINIFGTWPFWVSFGHSVAVWSVMRIPSTVYACACLAMPLCCSGLNCRRVSRRIPSWLRRWRECRPWA